MTDVVQNARTALNTNDLTTARAILTNQQGKVTGEIWWLLGQAVDDPAQKADCLARAETAGYAPPIFVPAPLEPAIPPAIEDHVLPWEVEPASPLSAEPELSLPWEQETSIPIQSSYVLPVTPDVSQPARFIQIGRTIFPESEILFAIEALGKQQDQYEVAKEIMLRNDVVYADAERFVKQVAEQNTAMVASKQLSTNLMVSISNIIGGLFITIMMILEFAEKVDLPFMGILDMIPLPLSVMIVIGLFSGVKFFNSSFFYILGCAYLFSLAVNLLYTFDLISFPLYRLAVILFVVGVTLLVQGTLTLIRSIYRLG